MYNSLSFQYHRHRNVHSYVYSRQFFWFKLLFRVPIIKLINYTDVEIFRLNYTSELINRRLVSYTESLRFVFLCFTFLASSFVIESQVFDSISVTDALLDCRHRSSSSWIVLMRENCVTSGNHRGLSCAY